MFSKNYVCLIGEIETDLIGWVIEQRVEFEEIANLLEIRSEVGIVAKVSYRRGPAISPSS